MPKSLFEVPRGTKHLTLKSASDSVSRFVPRGTRSTGQEMLVEAHLEILLGTGTGNHKRGPASPGARRRVGQNTQSIDLQVTCIIFNVLDRIPVREIRSV